MYDVPWDKQTPKQRMPSNVDEIPVAVDARDGFETAERVGDSGVNADLAGKVRALQVQQNKEAIARLRAYRGTDTKAGEDEDSDSMPSLEDIVQPMQTTQLPSFNLAPNLKVKGPPTSSEMIPALRGLNSWVQSEESNETVMHDVSSVRGKRLTSEPELGVGKAMVLHGSNRGDVQKRGRVKKGAKVSKKVRGDGMAQTMEGIEALEATSPGAAGQLTGTQAAPRQEQ